MKPTRFFRSDSGSEQFIDISVGPCLQAAELSIPLDGNGRKKLGNPKDEYFVYSAIAKLAWKSEESRKECMKRLRKIPGRGNTTRYDNVVQMSERMRSGEFPDYGFVFFEESDASLRLLDGTRRSIAFLEFGQCRIPIRIICPSQINVV